MNTACLSPNGLNTYRGEAPPTRLLVATFRGLNVLERAAAAAPWRLAGHALDGLHVAALLIEPRHGGVFAATYDDGVHFSPDGGRNWERRNRGIDHPKLFSLAYAEPPEGPTVYAGSEPVMLYRSRDAGLNWEAMPAITRVPNTDKWSFPGPPHLAHLKSMTVAADDPRHLYAAIEQGAFLQSLDGGASWRESGSAFWSAADERNYNDVHQIVPLPSDPRVLYMTTGNGLYRSPDGAAHWERLTDRGFRIGYPDHIQLSPLDERVVYVSGGSGDPYSWNTTHWADGTVMKSTDGGHSWAPASAGLPDNNRANIEAMGLFAWPGGYELYVGNTDGEVYASADEAASWRRIAADLSPISKGGHFHMLTADFGGKSVAAG